MVDYNGMYTTAQPTWYYTTSNASATIPMQGYAANYIIVDEVASMNQQWNINLNQMGQWITLDPMPDLKKDIQCADGWDPDEN